MSNVSLTESDSGKLVALQPGDELTVQLAENPTTGFAWTLEAGGTGALAPASTAFQTSRDPKPGTGGVRAFHFSATAPGTEQLRLKLWREWEGDRSIARRFNVTVQVGPS